MFEALLRRLTRTGIRRGMSGSRGWLVLGTNGDRRVRVADKELPVGSRYAASLSSPLDRDRSPATT